MTLAKRLAAALLALAVLTAGSLASARPIKIEGKRIERTVAAMVAEGRTVGASVLVWQGRHERLFASAGMADREAGRPFARDTLVQIFSMTKPVTGVALMRLWEDGRFRLDDPLAMYLPEFGAVQVYAGDDAAGNPILRPPRRPILVRDILRHTAGFVYRDGPGGLNRIVQREDPLNLDNTLSQFGQKLARVPLLDDPGARWSYSAAVDVQALLIERLSGQPYADYVRQNIFTPLGMSHTDWVQPASARAKLARIYEQKGGTFTPLRDQDWLAANFAGKPMTMGGAGLVSNVDDYLRFARMLLGGGSLDGVRIIKPETLAIMTTDMLDPAITQRDFLPGKGALGFGVDFAVRKLPPQNAEENRGAVGEFFWDGLPSMLFWIDPANDLVVIFATQKLPFDGTLHHDLREAVYGKHYAGGPWAK